MSSSVVSAEALDEIIIYSSIGLVMMAVVLIVFFYLSRKKILKYEIEKRDLIISHQKDMIASIIYTQEDERRRIAKDLHDDISSNLNIVSLNSHLLRNTNLLETEIHEITGNIINLTQKSLENSRRIAHDLFPPVLEKFGFDAGFKELCYDFSTAKSVQFDYINNLNFDSISISFQLQLFRILQELINNSMRHGQATQISILFDTDKKKRFLKYSDNGVGFEVSAIKNFKGLGLINIESRVSFINGTLKIQSKVGKGVSFTIVF